MSITAGPIIRPVQVDSIMAGTVIAPAPSWGGSGIFVELRVEDGLGDWLVVRVDDGVGGWSDVRVAA